MKIINHIVAKANRTGGLNQKDTNDTHISAFIHKQTKNIKQTTTKLTGKYVNLLCIVSYQVSAF